MRNAGFKNSHNHLFYKRRFIINRYNNGNFQNIPLKTSNDKNTEENNLNKSQENIVNSEDTNNSNSINKENTNTDNASIETNTNESNNANGQENNNIITTDSSPDLSGQEKNSQKNKIVSRIYKG